MKTLPDWARALGPPLCSCRIRSTPSDFVVTEQLDIEFSGDGEHDWLWIEKTGANTTWVADQLARHAGVHSRDVGYSGLKDRHAVTTQWFSVRRPSGTGTDWDAFHADGVKILEQHRHQRKLKRGTHRRNTFRIALRGDDIDINRNAIVERLERIKEQGVPNYFGEQRFGHDGGNIQLGEAVLAGRRMSRNKRSIGISALRSLVFNDELSERVEAGTWNRLLPGDVANLDGSGSVFDVDEVTADLEQRCAEMDIHPCGTLPPYKEIRVEAAYRPLRVRADNIGSQYDRDAIWLEFSLPKGSFATAILREIVTF
ncbi:MAG: tRNA pseudouridine(13) synthase TruD [Woeseiaceae bacterium]